MCAWCWPDSEVPSRPTVPTVEPSDGADAESLEFGDD